MSFSKAVIRYQTTISFLSFHRYGWDTQSNRIQCVKKGRWKTSTICQNLSTHSFTLNRENFSLKLQIKNKLVKDTKHVYPNQGISSKFQIKDKLVLQEKYLVLHPNCRTVRWRRREQLNGSCSSSEFSPQPIQSRICRIQHQEGWECKENRYYQIKH